MNDHSDFRLLRYPQPKCCATCSEWRVTVKGREVHPESVACRLQPAMTGMYMTKKVCDSWWSEYLNNPLTGGLYYQLLEPNMV